MVASTTIISSTSTYSYGQDYGGGSGDLPSPSYNSGDAELPPSWRTPEPKKSRKRGLPSHLAAGRKSERYQSNDWVPELAVGIGANIPEILPIDAHLVFAKWFRLRLFYSPEIPFKARVEMPSDVISTKNGVAVANPDFIIRMNASYGPSYGAEAMVVPLANSFFLSGGMSVRAFKLEGNARSGILVCSNIEAAKEPPCGDPEARLTTRTELVVSAKAKTQSTLLRASAGWLWQIADSGFFSIYGGLARPIGNKRTADVTTGIDSKGGDSNEEVPSALARVKVEKEAELEAKALKEMEPYDKKVIPILGLGGGFHF